MSAIQSICVYCGSSLGHDERYREAASRFGRALAIHKIRLIYGGGRIGLMGQVADAALEAGGKVVGVIPESLETLERSHRGLTELRVVRSMHERKNLMFEMADAFVVLPGGLGTLDEAIEMITWRQLGVHDKPIAFADIAGYWAPFIGLVDNIVDRGFARPDVRQHYLIIADIDQVVPTLLRQPAPSIPQEPQRL
ncbi:MAG: TIGR00730 family Rossman fold protein [Dongiaceae bacterium]